MFFNSHTRPAPKLKPFIFDHSWILYQDDDLLVANKPSGLLSVPGRGPDRTECLLSHLQTFCPECLIVHRLDMDTSGLMVLAKNKAAHRHLSIQFQERLTHKTYQALCYGRPSKQQGTIGLPMRCDWDNRPLQMVDFKQGKWAQTQWQQLEQFENYWRVELTPITGRSHQLRLHLQAIGHPILGDNLYADPLTLAMRPRLCLHATKLRFQHPKTLESLNFYLAPDF